MTNDRITYCSDGSARVNEESIIEEMQRDYERQSFLRQSVASFIWKKYFSKK